MLFVDLLNGAAPGHTLLVHCARVLLPSRLATLVLQGSAKRCSRFHEGNRFNDVSNGGSRYCKADRADTTSGSSLTS